MVAIRKIIQTGFIMTNYFITLTGAQLYIEFRKSYGLRPFFKRQKTCTDESVFDIPFTRIIFTPKSYKAKSNTYNAKKNSLSLKIKTQKNRANKHDHYVSKTHAGVAKNKPGISNSVRDMPGRDLS
jgi:hypothetical protein